MTKRGLIIDMQAHYIPAEALKLVRKTAEYDYAIGLKRFTKAYQLITDIEGHLEWMNDSGIDMAILSTAAFSANGSKFCRACNDGYSKIVRKYPDRFRGVIHVYPFEKTEVENEIRRGVEELGLWGVGVVSSYRKATLDAPVMDSIYKMAMKYGMPVYVHPTIRTKLWGGDHYDLYMTVTREYDIAKSFVEMVFGVIPRFPELKVIYAHFGGGLPALKGRLLAWHQPKGYPVPEKDRRHGMAIDQARILGLVDDFESRLKNFCFDSAGFGGWLPIIKSAFEALGSGHICLGTDYPYELREPSYVRKIIADIRKIGVPMKDKERFLGGNLKKLFGIA